MQRGSSNKWRCRARGCSWLRSVIHRGRSRRLPRGSTGRRRRRYCHCNIAQQCYLHTRRDRSTNMKHYLESDYRISPSQDQTETCFHREVIKNQGRNLPGGVWRLPKGLPSARVSLPSLFGDRRDEMVVVCPCTSISSSSPPHCLMIKCMVVLAWPFFLRLYFLFPVSDLSRGWAEWTG